MKTCSRCNMRYPNDASYCFLDGAALAEARDPRLGSVVAGRYVLEGVLGEGGMATVYLARHRLVDRPVAVKIMSPLLATDPVVRERFRREAKNAQKLGHPNVIEIYDHGETDDGTAFIVMELLRGEHLGAVIARGPMLVERSVHVMVQIARGLARAHDLDVMHRDVKPENVFLCKREDGRDLVKLLDFGIAKSRADSRLTGQGELFGTPQYMAPERIMGSDATPTSDLYALGVVFYEMLTGELPFDAEDVASFFVKHMNEAPPSARAKNADVPEALDELLISLLAKEARDRPVDAHRVHEDLLAILEAMEVDAPPTPETEPMGSPDVPVLAPAPGKGGWEKRATLLGRMLVAAFGDGGAAAPATLKDLYVDVTRLATACDDARRAELDAQTELGELERTGREARQRMGFAVDQLGLDASKAKDELRAAQAGLQRAEERADGERRTVLDAQRELLRVEGRAGMARATQELADAYRAAALRVEAWLAAQDARDAAKLELERVERAASDLEFQIRELRAALVHHEATGERERATREAALAELSQREEALEKELYGLVARLCEPLRDRPELAPLFVELAAGENAAA